MALESRLTRRSGRKQPILLLVSTHFLTIVMRSFSCITDNTGSQSVHRSFRPNKGSGGQIAHLQNIERIQTERTMASRLSHAAQLKKATVNEPLNPMAPMKSKPKPRVKAPSTRKPGVNFCPSLESVHRLYILTGPTTHELLGFWR